MTSHPNDEKYAHQRVFVAAVDDYVYLVPYVETEDEIFLKTVIPGRKAAKQYFSRSHAPRGNAVQARCAKYSVRIKKHGP